MTPPRLLKFAQKKKKKSVFYEFTRPDRPVRLYFSVPVDLYTVFSVQKPQSKNLAKNLVKNLANIWATNLGGTLQ